MKTAKELDAILKQIAVQVMQIPEDELSAIERGICKFLSPDYLKFDDEKRYWNKTFS